MRPNLAPAFNKALLQMVMDQHTSPTGPSVCAKLGTGVQPAGQSASSDSIGPPHPLWQGARKTLSAVSGCVYCGARWHHLASEAREPGVETRRWHHV
jgi:hypothetical protein